MLTVSGVYMKYVVQSVVSYGALYYLAPVDEAAAAAIGLPFQCLLSFLAYYSALNGVIAALFGLRQGMGMLGKDAETGQVPWWSYVLFVGFHGPTWLYTKLHRLADGTKGVNVADEVMPGWWVGGRYGNELEKIWAGIIDLTCEFPENCARLDVDSYMLLRCWDGVPPTPEQLEQAAEFAVRMRAKGHVIVHCAHGRGRSTTAMCACLVKAGLFKTWPEALAAIQVKRKVCKLNSKMRVALDAWQEAQKSSAKKAG